jgi:Flp pilus assembly pilin Flp
MTASGLQVIIAGQRAIPLRRRILQPYCVGTYRLWCEDDGQDVAEYAVMLSVILVLTLGLVKIIGQDASNVFAAVAAKVGS